MENERLIAQKLPGLLNTAAGIDLTLKLMEFWGEVFAGLFMVVDHWVIWYYSPERFIDLDERMSDGIGEDENSASDIDDTNNQGTQGSSSMRKAGALMEGSGSDGDGHDIIA